MLIRFSIENWMSFRDRTDFSMVASLERQHKERIPLIEKYNTKVLPVAAIYGGNASGKSNFFKAISFAKKIIVAGTKPDHPINPNTFRLDFDHRDKPSRFEFELLIEDEIYEYSFSVNNKIVIEEKLVLIKSTSEVVYYDRKNGEIIFHDSLNDKEFLNYAFRGTQENQLYLTNSVSQNVNNFKPIYDWFKDQLKLVSPVAKFVPFQQFLDDTNPLSTQINELLPLIDSGIVRLGGEEISFENKSGLGEFIANHQDEIQESQPILIRNDKKNERYVISRENGELTGKKLVTFHRNADGTETRFELRDESDGSQRIIDLLPAFIDISDETSNAVFLIDEIDRSLHTLLVRQLIKAFLSNCSPKSRSQLIFTTHDALLMDQEIFRRDEIWVTERDTSGNSTLFSFSEYKEMRNDKDIRKSYLQGRLGGVPRLLLSEALLRPKAK